MLVMTDEYFFSFFFLFLSPIHYFPIREQRVNGESSFVRKFSARCVHPDSINFYCWILKDGRGDVD